MTKLEHRALRSTHIRVPDDGGRTFEAVVLKYGVVDDYNTIFDPGCFTDSLETRLPRITWAHDWSDVIGRYVDYHDTPETLTLIGELDDFDAVPRARQAYAQLKSGTIDNFSVGFGRDKINEDDDGRIHFVKARLDEAALVLAGAVPGTKLVSVRSRSGLSVMRQVPEELVIDLAKKVAAGEMTKEEAAIALDLAGGELPDTKPNDPPTSVEPSAEDLAVIADADALVL